MWQRQEPPVKDSTTQIAERLNFRVRYGYGCNPLAMVANNNQIGLNSYKGKEVVRVVFNTEQVNNTL